MGFLRVAHDEHTTTAIVSADARRGQECTHGQNKAWLMFDGRPLVMHVIDRVLPLVDEVIVSTINRTRLRIGWRT